jgi:hypothetical protein
MATEQKAIVVSGDIVGSSNLPATARKKLQQLLDAFIKKVVKDWPDIKVQQYRGDSLQAILTTSQQQALRLVLLLHSDLIKEGFNIRLSIGVGHISYRGKQVITSDGSAFQASGQHLDVLAKSGEIISIAGHNEDFTGEWQVHSASLNYFIQNWSIQQAEAIYLQLQDYTQASIAQQLKISQPSVHQRLQGAGWPVVQKILQRFEEVVNRF